MVLDLPEGLKVLPPKPEPEGRFVVVRGAVRTVELGDLLMVPVVRKAVRFLTAAGGAL